MTDRDRERSRLLEHARAGRVVPAARILKPGDRDPMALFRALRATGDESFLLESVEGGESVARYTFLGCGPLARLTILDGVAVLEREGRARLVAGSPLEALGRLALRPELVPDPALPPLTGGAVGYLAYDAVRLFENIPDRHPREGPVPDGLFLHFDSLFAFDRLGGRLYLLTCLDGAGGEGPEGETDAAISRLDRLEALWRLGEGVGARPTVGAAEAFRPLVDREVFLERVEQAKEAIRAGDLYQVVLSQRWTAALGVDPLEVYRELRDINPSPYLFYLETREASVFGASPEVLVRCRGNVVETRPIAGTARRGGSREEDERLAAALLADPKERAEHVMLVDLARNDLGRVCELGSVGVTRYAAVEEYSHVQHLVSDVSGRLAAGKSSLDALAACFPAGTLTGAPKIRAMERIDAWESARRGIYGGAVGYLDQSGNLDVAIAIRTAVVEAGVCRVQAGAGIVADSVAETEYREVESKAAALFRAVELARGRVEARS